VWSENTVFTGVFKFTNARGVPMVRAKTFSMYFQEVRTKMVNLLCFLFQKVRSNNVQKSHAKTAFSKINEKY